MQLCRKQAHERLRGWRRETGKHLRRKLTSKGTVGTYALLVLAEFSALPVPAVGAVVAVEVKLEGEPWSSC